jgi:SAM-dependent MidA family methyltransferase
MAAILNAEFGVENFDVVEAGAGNGRLAADVIRAARSEHPAFHDTLRLHLVEASAEARLAQSSLLSDVADRVASSGASLPDSFEGALIANELLDALPVHQVVMRENGLHEVYVAAASELGRPGAEPHSESLTLVEGPLSTPALGEYLERLGVSLEPGWRVEINLRAVEWVRDAARRLRRGFMILIDYGHDARELYSASHSGGTLTTFSGHRSVGPEAPAGSPAWLKSPGEQDITAHVDFTSVRAAAEAEGMQTLGFLDQTYFVLGLLPDISNQQSASNQSTIRNLKTLMMPGGLGSTHKVLILAKGVGTPALRCCSFRVRVT